MAVLEGLNKKHAKTKLVLPLEREQRNTRRKEKDKRIRGSGHYHYATEGLKRALKLQRKRCLLGNIFAQPVQETDT